MLQISGFARNDAEKREPVQLTIEQEAKINFVLV